MNRTILAATLITLILITTIASGCISPGSKSSTATTSVEITKTVTTTATNFSTVTKYKTISSYYITTVYNTEFSTITIPVTTTIIISNGETSTVISSNGSSITVQTFVGEYLYENVPFLVYSVSDTTKIVTVPQTYSPIIGDLISFMHNTIEDHITDYTGLKDYIGDFDTLRVKIILSNFSDVNGMINYNDLYISHEYNSIWGAVYLAAFAANYHTPVTILLAVQGTIKIDAYAGFNNTFYSKDKFMYFNALQYSWFTQHGTYTEFIIGIDNNGIITRIDTINVTTIPASFNIFQSFASMKHYGLGFSIVSNGITETVTYSVDLDAGIATIMTTIGSNITTTIVTRSNNYIIITTISPTTIGETTENITSTVQYYGTTLYYSGVDVLHLFPAPGNDYNVRVINTIIMYTVYHMENNTLTIYEYTISSNNIFNASYIEVAIGGNTIASGTMAGYVN